jgi:phage terminase small subunit
VSIRDPSDPDGLTPRQRLFVDEYLVDLDGVRAAEAAGYKSPKGARARLLYNPLCRPVQKAIHRAMSERARGAQVRADEVLLALKEMAQLKSAGTNDPFQVFNPDGTVRPYNEIPEAVRRLVASIDVQETWVREGDEYVKTGCIKKIKFWDKNAAADKLMRHLALYKDKLEITGNVTLASLLAPNAVPGPQQLDAVAQAEAEFDALEDDEVFE